MIPNPLSWTRRPGPTGVPGPLAQILAGVLLLGATACNTTPPAAEPEDPGARTELLRQEAARAEAQRIERLKLDSAPGLGDSTTGAQPVEGSQPVSSPGAPSSGSSSGATARQDKPRETKKTKAQKRKELSNKIEKAVREVYLAELELELEKEKIEHGKLAAQDTLDKASYEVEKAQQELVRYRRVDSVELLGKQKLSIDRLTYRMEEASQNLEQMREEYGKFETDSVAKRTGDIVIWRAETQLDFAKRDLGFAKLAEKTLTRTTIPQKTEALEKALAQKQNALRQAKEALSRLDFENKLRLSKAENNVLYKQMALDTLREEEAAL